MTTETPRKQQIEDAASTLFRDRGYAGTSVRDIAQSLDMQGGSLYAHVASKEDVLWAIVVRAADRFNAEVAPIASSDRTAARKLRKMIRAHVAVVTNAQKDAAVFLHEWRFLSEDRRQEIAARRDNYEGMFRQAIAQGVKSGEFGRVDPAQTAMVVLSSLNGIATWYQPDGKLTPAQIADQHADLFLRALTWGVPETETSPTGSDA